MQIFVNCENEKIMEFVFSIRGVEYISEYICANMRKSKIEQFNSGVTAFQRFSVRMAMRNGYRFRYIYIDTEGNTICEVFIAREDLQ